jgi:hypothetical protein
VRVGLPLGDLVPAEADEDVAVPVVVSSAQRFAAPPQRPVRTIVVGDAPPPPVSEHARTIMRPSVARVAVVTPPDAGFRWGVLVLFVLAIGLGGAAGWYLRVYGIPELPF